MKIQVEFNILSDDELKNQWGSYLDGHDLELNQNKYRIGEFIFTFNDLLSSMDVEKIMEESYQFIKEKYALKSIQSFSVLRCEEKQLYCYIIAGTYKELEKTLKRPWRTILDYPVYFKHHYLIYMKSLNISFDDICVIEKQKFLKSRISKFMINFITIVIFSIVFSLTHNYVLASIIFLIEIIILWVLERPGGLRVSRN